MAALIFIILVLIALYYKFLFNQTLKKVQSISIQHDLMIFDAKYKSAFQMGNNINFLNKLWAAKLIKSINNIELRTELNTARRLFRYQLGYGFLSFLSVVVNGFIIASYS